MAIDTQQSIFSEVADFLVSQPTAEERLEMEKILAVSHLISLAKAIMNH